MATVREGNQAVLLVVDVQVGVMSQAWDAARVIGNVSCAVEPRIDKHFNPSFEQTVLDEQLARLGATHIVLAGAASNGCIRANAYGALDRGYDLTLVKDAHTTASMALDDGTRIEAESVVKELNTAMTWLSDPGRKNGIAAAAEVDFAEPGNKA